MFKNNLALVVYALLCRVVFRYIFGVAITVGFAIPAYVPVSVAELDEDAIQARLLAVAIDVAFLAPAPVGVVVAPLAPAAQVLVFVADA